MQEQFSARASITCIPKNEDMPEMQEHLPRVYQRPKYSGWHPKLTSFPRKRESIVHFQKRSDQNGFPLSRE